MQHDLYKNYPFKIKANKFIKIEIIKLLKVKIQKSSKRNGKCFIKKISWMGYLLAILAFLSSF